jgi:uncharacterized membrane protein YbaN (DUF454 family)
MQGKLKNPLWIILAVLAFCLGTIGIFIPFLPTTPFFPAVCGIFSKRIRPSLPLVDYFISIWRIYLQFQSKQSHPDQNKNNCGCCTLGIHTGFNFPFPRIFGFKGMLIAIGAGITIHILHYKTLKDG